MSAPTETQKQRVRDLVHRLYSLSGAESQTEFAIRCQVLPSQVSDWLRGENAPSAFNLLKMLEVAGAYPGEQPRTDVALLTRIVEELEADPQRASGDLVAQLQALSASLRELSTRLHQATARSTERWQSG